MRKRFTKPIWRLHSVLGLVCGLVLIVVGLTGSLLVFRAEVDAFLSPELYRAQPTAAGRLPYDALWTSLRRALPEEKIVGWMPAAKPGLTDGIYLQRTGEEEPRLLHLNPYTGEVRGRPVAGEETLTGWLLELHYALLAGTWGTFVTGLIAVALLVLGLSGVWLYRGFWRNFFTLRWGRSARIFFSDLHKMVGISSVGFNLILGVTGAWWNLNTVYWKWTHATPFYPPPKAATPPFNFAAGGMSLDALMARAGQLLPGYHLKYLGLPPEQEGSVTLYGNVPTPNPLRGDYASHVVFNAADGTLTQVTDSRKASVGETITDSFALLHYGTFGASFGPVVGVAVRVLWTILGLAPGVLAVSGFLIWRARRRQRPVSSSLAQGKAAAPLPTLAAKP